MEDILTKYKKKKKYQRFGIITVSLVLAISINYAFSNTKVWEYIKTNIQEQWNKKSLEKAYIYLEKVEGSINSIMKLKNSKKMSEVKTITFSMTYNPGNVNIKNIFSDIQWSNISNLWEKNQWYTTVTITFDNYIDIEKNQDIANILVEKNNIDLLENINLINVNFEDKEWIIYKLTMSGIDF